MGQCSHFLHMQKHVTIPTHAQWPLLSPLAFRKYTREAEGETQTQREATGTSKRKHVFSPAPNVSMFLLRSSLVLTLWRNNKGEWWELSSAQECFN